MADLSTTYMGLKLRNPLIVASSDMTGDVEKVIACHEAGAGAVVLKSIFEEQFLVEGDVSPSTYGGYSEAIDYLRHGGLLDYAPRHMVDKINEMKKKVDIPVIASVNCQSPTLWLRFAKQLQDAGADGLELNVYFLPLELDVPCSEYETRHLRILEEVKKSVSIPVSVKLSAQITSVPYLGKRLADAGCDALVLFNWFLQPDVDIKSLKTRSVIGVGDFFHSLRWVALLAGRVSCDLAASGGINSPETMVKQLLGGAVAVQVCSVLYRKGLDEIKVLLKGLEDWMVARRFERIQDFRGNLSFKNQNLKVKGIGEAASYFRAQYLKTFIHLK
ncbi:MAG: dihydroorotate dehydrogenase-like protein [Candidatus Aminicenantes bacterium]|nr:dihydroorotate dehydrogenase-like protein [Candidatus Aminicenantes bacterium]